MKKNKLIGDRKFYAMVLAVAVPIMIQNGFTNFVSMLDNIMVGRVGTEEMSSVAIVNQLIFVYNLCIFGGLSGVGIFTSQYFGQNDMEGIRNTFRIKLILAAAITIAGILVFTFFGEKLIGLYLTGSSDGGDLQTAMDCGMEYLRIMLWGLPAFMFIQIYASTLRECTETMLPMKAGISAVLVNLIFNYLLIFGKFGFPRLGVSGAAIATVLSRIVELSIVMIGANRNRARHKWLTGAYRTLRVPGTLVKKVVRTGSPLLLNEALWSAGVAMLTQAYSVRGLNAVAAFNIANTIGNVSNVVFYAFGSSVGIIIGRLLGAGKMEEAVETDTKIIAFSVFSCIFIALFTILLSPFFPELFNTTDQVKLIARNLIIAQALFMPLSAFKNASYFTLRSGGRTLITFFFDGGFIWMVSVPIAFLVSRFTSLDVIWLFVCVQAGDSLKCILGYILVKKKVWLRNIVN